MDATGEVDEATWNALYEEAITITQKGATIDVLLTAPFVDIEQDVDGAVLRMDEMICTVNISDFGLTIEETLPEVESIYRKTYEEDAVPNYLASNLNSETPLTTAETMMEVLRRIHIPDAGNEDAGAETSGNETTEAAPEEQDATFFTGLSMKPMNRADKWLKALMMVHGVFYLSCTFMPMTGMFSKMSSNGGSLGGRIALVVWCAYFLPVGILVCVHFSRKEK